MTKKAPAKKPVARKTLPVKPLQLPVVVKNPPAIVEAYQLALEGADVESLPLVRAEISDLINRLHNLLEETR